MRSKFSKVFRFEFCYHWRQVSTWLLFAALFVFGFLILRSVTLAGDTKLNAPSTIIFFTVFGGLIWMIAGGAVAGDAATRDFHTGMHPLTFTAPMSKLSYLGSRILAAITVNTFMLLALFGGFLLSLYAPGARTQFIAPFRAATFLSAFLVIALPGVIITTVIQFSISALSKRAIAAYIASMLIIVLSQFGGASVLYLLEWRMLGKMLDLAGTTLVAEMEGWTPIEKNTRLVIDETQWLFSRLLWFLVAGGAAALTYYRFHLKHINDSSASIRRFFAKRNKTQRSLVNHADNPDQENAVQVHTDTGVIQNIVPAYNISTRIQQVMMIAKSSFLMIAQSWFALTIVAILAIGTGLFATEYMEWLGVPLRASTSEVLRILAPPLSSFTSQWNILPLLSIFYAGELLWRERDLRANEITDTTPVPDAVILTGKFLGLAMIIATWMAMLMVSGIINQLVMNYHHFEFSLYVKVLFGIQFTNYLLFAMLVFVMHVLINQKYLGHLAGLCAYAFILFASMLGLSHHLLIYASDPGWLYSDMRGFAPTIGPWLWFKLYWIGWGAVLGVVSTIFWVRGREKGSLLRFRLAKQRLHTNRHWLILALAIVLLSGGYIFYNTNVLNTYWNKNSIINLRAGYEKKYGAFERIPQPVIVNTSLNVDIYPGKRSAEISGQYQLQNHTDQEIDSIHISMLPGMHVEAMNFNALATPVVLDEEMGYHIYALNKPLEPGDSLQLRFRFRLEPSGFTNDGYNTSIVTNGTHLSDDVMPVIGFDEDRVLRTVTDRELAGLPARLIRPSLYDAEFRKDVRHAQKIHFQAIVGTSGDEVAVAPGDLVRTWEDKGRKYFQYSTNAPISNEYTFFSARYAIREERWIPVITNQFRHVDESLIQQPVVIQIYHHPGHAENIDRMIQSAKASLDFYTKTFGPYPYNHFRVLERPGDGRGMHAESMTIDYEEGYSLMSPTKDGLDLPYHIMAHETAHQWWGLGLVPAAVEGSGLLVESLATYSAMQVVEESLGYEHLLRYLSQMRLEYEVPRSKAAPPLLRSNNAFMHYRKGPFALFALRNYIGPGKVNEAMRALIDIDTSGGHLVTTLDFYNELKRVTPDSLHYLVHDLFAANTFWELNTEKATTVRTKSGQWEVTIYVKAKKLIVDEQGVETPLVMNDLIEIGVFEAKTPGQQKPKSLYLQKHRIKTGTQTIKILVGKEPKRAGIDPHNLLIDVNTNDNTIDI
jgi:hypothetical protein